MIGVSVTFQYDQDFDHARVVSIAENARGTFEGMPGLRSKVFTVDDAKQRAMNFYLGIGRRCQELLLRGVARASDRPVRRRTHDRLH